MRLRAPVFPSLRSAFALARRLPALARRAALCLALAAPLAAQTVHLAIDPTQDRHAVSPYIYGKNDSLGSPSQPLSAADWQRYRDAGVRLIRAHGGNNGTKYNWQKKLTSHPDWYNNVYADDWDYAQAALQQHLPGVQGLWCFQLLGQVADNTQHNFDDWGYNHSAAWSGVNQNLAGGGIVNPAGGSHALKDGDPALYLTATSADTSTALLDHWIQSTDLALDRRQFLYWNMDNEPEIWSGTHDDVMPQQIPAEDFMQRYFAYAKLARARFPEIKLMGPVPANEWQWYNWSGGISAGGRNYPWLEYFIKRIGEEEARTGIRLLDVLDLHFYPSVKDPAAFLQTYRTFFDRTYVYPEANGVHAVNGGWDPSINQEYVFARCQDWLNQYLGPDNGVTFSVSETSPSVTDPSVVAVWYASMLGEFMRHPVEVFSPWDWPTGMWEVLHLFSRYNYATSVRATSDDETEVSAYATTDDTTGNLTVVLVNRALTASKSVAVSLAHTALPDGPYETLQLANLPATETFVSHTDNALRTDSVTVTGGQFALTLPPLSITSVLLRATPDVPPPAGTSQLANLSVRAACGTGDSSLIVGFVVGGTGAKPVLLRGVGPTLAHFGISAPAADPTLALGPQGGAVIATNDDWGANAAQVTDVSARVGAFALDPGSRDAALVASLPSGAYSAVLADKSGGGGVALGEVYDGDLAGGARLLNVSARTQVGTGANALIAGFVVSGTAPKTLLIRAVGPGLTPFGVSGVLADPVLQVYAQGEPQPRTGNDDWGTIAYADQIEATAHAVNAFPLPVGSKDAALLLTLPPGNYSAVVTGQGGTTGVALVEVYEVP